MLAVPSLSFPVLAARVGLLAGIVAPVLWVTMIVVCAALTPDYAHLRDYISELAARDAPTAPLMRWGGFVVTGVGYVAFAAVLAWRSRFDLLVLVGAALIALGGIARVLAGLHPCDPGCTTFQPSTDQVLHGLFARIGYFAMIVAALYWGIVGNRYRVLRRLSPLGIGCGVWATVFLVVLLVRPGSEGLWQRLASGTLSLWMFAFALAVYRGGLLVQALAAAPAGKPGELTS